MKNILITILCIFTIKLFAQDYVADEIYVKLKSTSSIKINENDEVMNLADFKSVLSLNTLQQQKLTVVKAPFYFSQSAKIRETLSVKIASDIKIEDMLGDLNNDPNVEYAERIPVMEKSFVPNDLGSNLSNGQWALHKIMTPNAWDISTGNSSIVVAVVDDAIQTDHTDLNGKCLQGRDVADGDNDPRPSSTCHSHGTHVSGIVGASTNNATGIASIGYEVSILPVKATYDADQSCRAINRAYEGVLWAADNGADIINMSWGGGFSTTGQNIINYASSKGILLVAAAGNSNSANFHYPAAYNNVISVAATDINDSKASFSSYGNWVDVSAPGASIKSTVPFNSYAVYNGTSMASPMVAGLCGLVWSVDLSQSPQSVINCVLNTADDIYAQNPGYIGLLGTGRINAYQALMCASPPVVCDSNETFTAPIGGFLDQEVSNWIEGKTNNVIQVGANVTYDAGNRVRLKPGFKALEGSRFHAFIDGCGGNAKVNADTHGMDAIDNDIGLKVYPNPLSESANISYTLPKEDRLTISIFDAMGKTISILAKNKQQTTGQYQIDFDAQNLSTGIYYLKLQSNEMNIIKKMMITK